MELLTFYLLLLVLYFWETKSLDSDRITVLKGNSLRVLLFIANDVNIGSLDVYSLKKYLFPWSDKW